MSATTPVPIWVFDETDSLVAIIGSYESAAFTRDWQNAGPFSITINAYILGASEFKRGRSVLFGTDKRRFGIITEVIKYIDENGKGGERISVTGYEMKKVLDWRMVQPLVGKDYFYYSAPAETIMQTLVKWQADPAFVTDADRGFSKLVREADSATGATYLLNSRWSKTVLEELTTCSLATGHGSWIEYNVTGPLTFNWMFRTREGVDRRASQSVNGRVILNTAYGTLRTAQLTDSDVAYKSVAYVAGQGVGAARTIRETFLAATSPTDRNRREMFVDARDLTNVSDLILRGISKLTENGFSLFLDATALAVSQLQLGVDYDLGDLITASQFGVSIDTRITKVKESWQANNYTIDLTFDKHYPEIPEIVKNNLHGLETILNTSEHAYASALMPRAGLMPSVVLMPRHVV